MTTHLTAMATALAVRSACARQIEKDRALDSLDLSAIMQRVMRSAAECLPCADDVFDGIAQAIQA